MSFAVEGDAAALELWTTGDTDWRRLWKCTELRKEEPSFQFTPQASGCITDT